MQSLVAAVARHAPQSLVRLIGRHVGRNRLLGPVDRIARQALAGDMEIAHGRGAGLRFNSAGGRAGFALGTWEPETQEALADLLQRGDVLFDVGAATGFHTIIAARHVGPGGRIIAFEPFVENLVALRHNIALNELTNVEVIDKAIADSDGVAVMVPEASDEVSLVMQRLDREGADERSVEVTSLDALLESGRVPAPTVVKMDVEGAEVEVLNGARALLARERPTLLIEVHERWDELAPILDETGYDYRPLEGIDPADADHAVHIVATPRATS